MLKKISYIVLLITTLFVLYACNTKNVETGNTNDNPNELTQKTDGAGNKVEIGVYSAHSNTDVDSSFLGYGINLSNHTQVNARNTNITYPVFDRTAMSNAQVIKVYETMTNIRNIEGKSMSEYMKNLQINGNYSAEFGGGVGKLDIEAGFTASTKDSREHMFKTIDVKEQSYYLGLQVNPNSYPSMLSAGFITDARELSVEQFVRRYGSHILTSVTMGGAMKLDYTLASYDSSSVASINMAVDLSVRTWFGKGSGGISVDYREELKNRNASVSVNLGVIGGETVGIYTEQDIVTKYGEWQKSIESKPALMGIKDDNSLYPIWDLVSNIDASDDFYRKKASEIQTYFLNIGQENYKKVLSQYSDEKIVFPSEIKNVTLQPEGNTEQSKIQTITYKTGIMKSNARYKLDLEYNEQTTGHHSITYVPIVNSPYVTISPNGIVESHLPDDVDNVNIEVKINAGLATRNVKLYIEKVYRIDFMSNGGSDVKSIEDIERGTTIYEPISPVRENYVFLGWWYKDVDPENPTKEKDFKYEFGKSIDRDLVLHAKWERLLTVTYLIDDETSNVKYNLIKDITIVENDFIPVKDGYQFIGWYTDRLHQNKYEFGHEIDKDLVLYAKWEKLLTVSYYDGNNLVYESYGFKKGEDIVNNEYTPRRDGYEFKGWYVDRTYLVLFDFGKAIYQDSNIYAKWEKLPLYTLTFDFNDSNNSFVLNNLEKNTQINITKYPELVSISKLGHSFLGWYYVIDGEEFRLSGDIITISSDFTLKAKWRVKNKYTINFDFNYGNRKVEYKMIEEGSIFTVDNKQDILDPRRWGYQFAGWYLLDTNNNERRLDINEFVVNENLNFIAKWDEAEIKVEYINTTLTEHNNPVEVSLSKPFTLLPATRRGYNFLGWYQGEKNIEVINLSNYPDGTTEITLEAKWEIASYQINYHGIDSNNPNNPLTYKFEDKDHTLYIPIKRGHTFKGWYDNPSFTTQIKVISKDSAGNINLYAKWEKDTYTISYKNIDENNSNNPLVYQYGSETSLHNVTKIGYTFIGWYKDSLDGEQITLIKDSVGNLELYAKWEKDTYEIIYHNIDLNNENNPNEYQYDSNYELHPVTKIGYTFIGWYKNYNLTERVEATNGLVGTLNLYAKWEKTAYSIDYFNVDNLDVNNPTTYFYDQTISLNSPTKHGHIFEGWFLDDNYQNEISEIKNYTQDLFLYAKWKKQSYIINYYNAYNNNINNPNYYYYLENVTLYSPNRTGYIFVGWYLNSNLTNKITEISNRENDINLYAKWEVDNNVSISFSYNILRSFVNNPNRSDYKIGDTVYLTNASSSDSSNGSFLGWYYDSKGTRKVTSFKITENITIYGLWQNGNRS